MLRFHLHLNLSRFTLMLIGVLLCLLQALFNTTLFATSAENQPARSGCSMQGEIIEDTLWSPSDCNPYTVVGSLVVMEEVTLTIEPGTTVKFDFSTIHAQGTIFMRANYIE